MAAINYQMIMIYFAMVVVFSVIYYNMSSHLHYNSNCDPSRYLDNLYFSMTISSTVGFGDIVPKSPAAKIIVIVHQICLITLAAILIL